MEYGSSVWDPAQCVAILEELESVQKCAARFVKWNYNYETFGHFKSVRISIE